MRLAAAERDGRSLKAYANAYAANQRLLRTSAAKEAAERAAVEAGQAKSAFLRGLNHELRTPLNAITGFGGLMRAQPQMSDEKRAEYLGHVLSSADILLGRIDAILLAASGVEAGRPQERTCADLLPALRTALRTHQRTIFLQKVHIEDHLPALALGGEPLGKVLDGLLTHIGSQHDDKLPVGCRVSASPGRDSIGLRFEVRGPCPHPGAELQRLVQGYGLELSTESFGEGAVFELICPSVQEPKAA